MYNVKLGIAYNLKNLYYYCRGRRVNNVWVFDQNLSFKKLDCNESKSNKATIEERYAEFVANYNADENLFDGNNYVTTRVEGNMDSSVVYTLKKDAYGSLVYNDSTRNEVIARNILSYYVIKDGNGGMNSVFFLNQDGTVGRARIEDASGEIKIDDDLGLKYIVSVIQGRFGNEYVGGYGPIFIDLDGHLYKLDNSLY